MIVLLALVLAQGGLCDGDAAMEVGAAAVRLDRFDLAGALDHYERAARLGCADAEIALHYVRGLAHAREAYRRGGDAPSLQPVVAATRWLEQRSGGAAGPAAIASAVLRAAAAAAQSERDEMAIWIEHAVAMETLQRAAGQPAAPAMSAIATAGDLWLQVHGYDEARRAYRRAIEQEGATPHTRLGLARGAAREQDVSTACAEYGAVMESWERRAEPDPPEITEARTFLERSGCGK
jgi:tetratricopeptide (TPR) repeat protein